MKFRKGRNFEMQITKENPNWNQKTIWAKKLQFSIDFSQNYYINYYYYYKNYIYTKYSSKNSVAMTTVDVPWD